MFFKEKLLSPAFSVFFFPLSSFLSLSLSLSCGFCLDQVLADVKNGLANCNFEMQRKIL